MGLVPHLLEERRLEAGEDKAEVVRPISKNRPAGDEVKCVGPDGRPVPERAQVGTRGRQSTAAALEHDCDPGDCYQSRRGDQAPKRGALSGDDDERGRRGAKPGAPAEGKQEGRADHRKGVEGEHPSGPRI